MRILITNDDGVYSPGIAALAQVATHFGQVRVVAPDVEMSSAAQSITASRPLSVKRTPLGDIDAYRVNGTPGDCVMIGTTLWEGVTLVLSGINLGSNLGNALWHSGTLAGAKQAALLGLPAQRVFAVDANAFFARPGPRLVDGVELLAHLLHPELVEWQAEARARKLA